MNRFIPHFLILGLLFGCATTRDYTPDFRPFGRQGLDLVHPVNLAFFDARTEKKDDLAPLLQAGVQRAYGKNIRVTPYFSPPPSGEVTVKVRILRLQSDFGSRVISVPVLLNSQSVATAAATNGWNTVVADRWSGGEGIESRMATLKDLSDLHRCLL